MQRCLSESSKFLYCNKVKHLPYASSEFYTFQYIDLHHILSKNVKYHQSWACLIPFLGADHFNVLKQIIGANNGLEEESTGVYLGPEVLVL